MMQDIDFIVLIVFGLSIISNRDTVRALLLSLSICLVSSPAYSMALARAERYYRGVAWDTGCFFFDEREEKLRHIIFAQSESESYSCRLMPTSFQIFLAVALPGSSSIAQGPRDSPRCSS